jgi:hypothetical protein
MGAERVVTGDGESSSSLWSEGRVFESYSSVALSGVIDDEQSLFERLDQSDREAQLAILKKLTELGTPAAVEAIYRFTVEQNDPSIGDEIAAGLSHMTVTPDTFSKFVDIAASQGPYAYLAAQPLMRAGRQGVDALVEAADSVRSNTEYYERLTIEAAFDLSPPTREYLTSLSLTTSSPTPHQILTNASTLEHDSAFSIP